MSSKIGAAAMGELERIYRRSLEDREGFWADAARAIDWDREPERVLDDSQPPFYRWFAGGELNTCHNALDRHVAGGRADQTALVYDSPVTGTVQTFTYAELLDRVARLAGALAALGVGKGDRVVLYMPMVPEAVFGDARVRTARGDSLGRVRRLCGARARGPDRRRATEGRPLGLVRDRGRPGDRVQAAPRPGARGGEPRARAAA